METVYIEDVFLLNATVDYLLLLSAARLSGEVIRRRWLVLGSVLGGLYAITPFFTITQFLSHILCQMGVALVMVVVAFGTSKRLLRLTVIFFGLACGFGGGMLALALFLPEGAVLDGKGVVLGAVVCYGVATAVFHGSARHGAVRRDMVGGTLTWQGRSAQVTALVDTGNTLTDPLTNRPVIVVEGAKVQTLFPKGVTLDSVALRQPVDTLERLGSLGRNFRLLPYRAVGVDCGMLLALRLDSATIGQREYGDILAALSPTGLSDGGGYNALIGA